MYSSRLLNPVVLEHYTKGYEEMMERFEEKSWNLDHNVETYNMRFHLSNECKMPFENRWCLKGNLAALKDIERSLRRKLK